MINRAKNITARFARETAIVGAIYIAVLLFEVKVVFPLEARILTHHATITSILFLPHAVRVLATLIVGPRVFFSLLVALLLYDYLWLTGVGGAQTHILFYYSVVGAGCAPLAFWLVNLVNRSTDNYQARLRNWRMVLQVGLIASLLNSIGRTLIFNLEDTGRSVWEVASKVIIGDMLGLVLGLLTLLFIVRMLNRSSLSSRQ